MSLAPSVPLLRRAAWTASVTTRAPVEGRLPFRSPARLEALQRRRIAAAVAHAHAHVPHYREAMRRRGIGPGDIATAADLAARLPIVERAELQRDPERFLSDDRPASAHLELRTSGSSGDPILFHRDARALLHRLVAFQRLEPVLVALTGKRLRRRHALVAPPASSTADVDKATRHRVLPPVRTVHATFSLFTAPDELAAQVVAFGADVVTGYGSAIEGLFASLLRDGTPPGGHLPSVAIYAADGLSAPMRRALVEAGVAVLSVYQAVETPTIGFECEAHAGHHVNADLCPVRVLGSDGAEAAPGEPGEVVVSNLVNRGTVLLNYRLGDLAATLPGPCACGRSLPRLSLVQGRTTDWLTTAGGRRVHPQALRAVMRTFDGLLRERIVQVAPGRVRIEMVVAGRADREAIRSRLEAEGPALADPLAVEVAFCDTLPREANGKVRSLVR